MVTDKPVDTSTAEQGHSPASRRTFVTPSSREVAAREDPSSGQAGKNSRCTETQPEVEELDTRIVVTGVVMVVIGLVCGVLVFGSIGANSESTVNEADAKAIFALREEINTAQTRTEELPSAKDAERGLVVAAESADRIAQLQNDYRGLVPQIAEIGGERNPELTLPTRQELTPYFTPSTEASVMEPWYLLADDAEVPVGVGVPMSFDSGVEWVADVPTTIDVEGRVPVIWRAIETHVAEGTEPGMLAWVTADYDIVGKTFSDVRIGVTVHGEARQMEVKQG